MCASPTDNGAYYYYNTARYPNGTRKNYEETLLDVHAYAKGAGIPYKYALLDSWWYQKGEGGGVKNWTAQPNIFPDGAKYLADKTGWKFQVNPGTPEPFMTEPSTHCFPA